MTIRYDFITEVKKHGSEAKTFEEILKFNPYHDALGRFASANGATSMTIHTKSPAGQKAIANIKAKAQAAAAGGGGGGSGSDSAKPAETKQPEVQVQPKKLKYIMEATQMKGHKSSKYLNDWDEADDNTAQKVANDLHVSKDKAKEMAVSINKYSGSYYDDIRASSRGDNNDYKHEADMCEQFIKASPKWAGGKIYRGIKVYNKADADAIIAKAWKKQPIDMRGVSSWSSKKSVADDFSGGSHPIVFVTNGTSTNKGTSIQHLSRYKKEAEVLMSKDAVFTPTKIRTAKNGTIYIYGDMT